LRPIRLLQLAAHFNSVHFRHDQVHQRAIEGFIPGVIQTLASSGSLADFISVRGQRLGETFQIGRAIVDRQKARPMKIGLLRSQNRGPGV